MRNYMTRAGIAPTVSAFLEGMPAAPTTAKTDADGKFSLSLKKGTRYAIRAVASRAVFDRTENYEWLILLTPNADGARLTLANDNLMETTEGIKATEEIERWMSMEMAKQSR
jgi:hypothetical protein